MADKDDDEIIDENFYKEHAGEAKKGEEDPEPEVNNEEINQKLNDFLSKEISEEFSKEFAEDPENADRISDNAAKQGYLERIFSPRHDKYGSLNYYKDQRKKLISSGFPEGPLFDSYLFYAVKIRILQIFSQESHKTRAKQGAKNPEDLTILNALKSLVTNLEKIQKSLISQRDSMRSGSDIHDLHQQEIEDNAKFVKEHIGEFSWRCKKCDTIVQSGGLPHWAFKVERDDLGDPIYHVWSSELFYAVNKGIIPLHMMAFGLQTSIEGLKETAIVRGEKMIEFDIVEEEKKLFQLMQGFEKHE